MERAFVTAGLIGRLAWLAGNTAEVRGRAIERWADEPRMPGSPVRLLAAVLLLVVLGACAPGVERVEVVRVTSPDGGVDAVVVQSAAGVGSPFGYTLGLADAGCPVAGEPVLRVVGATRSASASGVAVTWVAPRTVRVSWLDARFRDPDVDTLVVASSAGPVTVLSGIGPGDPSAPAGGMPEGNGPSRSC